MAYKIKITSPLVSLEFEDTVSYSNDGYIRHNVPSPEESLVLIKQLENTVKEIIFETIRAHKHGCIDLKKWKVPANPNVIDVNYQGS